MDKNLINIKSLLLVCITFIICGTGCKKLVETDPPSDTLTGTSVFLTDATAIAVFNSLYSNMNGSPFQGSQSISLLSGLGADELSLFSSITTNPYPGYYNNALVNQFGITGLSGGEQWGPLYNGIFKCNDALNGLSKSTTLTTGVKNQLIGEAKFLRAFYYFYLVNLFGDVPLALNTDPDVNSLLPRSSKVSVYEQIIKDLKEAEEVLSTNFLDVTLLNATTERVRPTKWAATALLSRAYLYLGKWAEAEGHANTVITNTNLFGPLPTLNNTFLKNSREAIWQVQPTDLNLNTIDGNTWIIPTTGPGGFQINPVMLSKMLLNSFEPNDNRAVLGNWINRVSYPVGAGRDTVYFNFKYKKDAIASNGISSIGAMTEYFMVLRLAEQYLIRAEARAKQGKIAEAKADLDAIRTRAGLPGTSANDEVSLLVAILEERRHELFCEWGHRWLDLKRTGKIDDVMNIITPIKSNGATTWHPYQALYPIPYLEIQRAPNLVQNAGY